MFLLGQFGHLARSAGLGGVPGDGAHHLGMSALVLELDEVVEQSISCFYVLRRSHDPQGWEDGLKDLSQNGCR